MEATAEPGETLFQVLVHSFSWCTCRSETFSTDHIKLKTSRRSLGSGHAVALSYGIGDFDRQKHLFGHLDRLDSAWVRLEFGGEWEIQGLMNVLVALSDKHGAIWLDQLSIPQDPVSLAIHLQNMPRVYNMLEVVVLLPNAPCPCLNEALESWAADGSWAWKDGDFHISAVAGACLNAFPVSSYHFRLWTKLEFAYAGVISIHYCGAPPRQCSRETYNWLYRSTRIPTQSGEYLSRWASWKYASCAKMSQQESEYSEEMAWSMFRDAHVTGRDHLLDALTLFNQKKDMDMFFENLPMIYAQVARFILGERLQRTKGKQETLLTAEIFNSEHVATVQKDFALAVLPSFGNYKLPPESSTMTLPELVEDGIEQYELHSGGRNITRVPKGLFELTMGSMRYKPTLYLREDKIRCLGDVYGALESPTYQPLVHQDMTMLRLRGGTQPPASRIAQSKTYLTAFGDSTTAEVCEFMRKVGKIKFGNIAGRTRVQAHRAWAAAIYRDRVPAPHDKWPSREHEQAILEESLHYDRPWGSWPELDHERVCYELMCNYVCIHPDVAREKNLALVVKTSDPPNIGFINGMIFDDLRVIEEYQSAHGVPAPPLRTRKNDIYPEDWLTMLVTMGSDLTAKSRLLTLEALKARDGYNLAEHMDTDEPRLNRAVPMYLVVGVWFSCLGSDPCIGAELIRDPEGIYDAILI
jgi:hypothetical protein